MTRHTPGPWIVFADRTSDAMVFSVLPAGRTGEIASGIENGPDADLIAAAPLMLDVLRAIDAANPGIPLVVEAIRQAGHCSAR